MKDWFVRNRFEQTYIDEAIIASCLLSVACWAVGYFYL
jgi:hypothetical protein